MKQTLTPETDFAEGCIINFNKPYGWTSTDVVRKVKFTIEKITHKHLKVGHAGTLDPLATGVLVVCTGRATKQVDALQAERKEYTAEVMLGATTPSFDLEHPVDARYPYEHITREMAEQALISLSGERMQVPPVYSAKKFEGKRAYEFAREGSDVEMEQRQVLINIYKIELVAFELPKMQIRVECSKGTYIRALAREIGEALGSGAHLTALCRTRSGNYRIEDAITMDEFKEQLSLTKTNI